MLVCNNYVSEQILTNAFVNLVFVAFTEKSLSCIIQFLILRDFFSHFFETFKFLVKFIYDYRVFYKKF